MEALNRITDLTGAEIVVSSAWRHEHTLNGLRKVLSDWGVTGEVVDVTPSHLLGPHDPEEGRNLLVPRIVEIAWWLKKEPGKIGGFVIIDDNDPQEGCDFDRPRPDMVPHMVLTETAIGLTETLADAAISVLKSTGKRIGG